MKVEHTLTLSVYSKKRTSTGSPETGNKKSIRHEEAQGKNLEQQS